MISNFIVVALGAAIGVLARVLLTKWITRRWRSSFPAATFLINISGSLLLGLITALSFGNILSLLFSTGMMGSFTTFSTFNVENLDLLRNREYKYFFVYICGSYILGIVAIFAGISLGSMF